MPATDNGQRTTNRSGISLMEVLISIGIMAIGMLSIASLLPVGGAQVEKANIEERKAELGLNAYREFQIRGMGDPNKWMRHTTGTTWVAYNAATPALTAADLPPLAIDPFMIGVARKTNQAADNTAVDRFPANTNTSLPALKRLTLSSIYNTNTNIERALAEHIMMLANELVVTQPEDRTLPAQNPDATEMSEAQYHRPYEGNYTWMATLAPQLGDTSAPAAMSQYVLSVVVFDRRRAATPTAGSGQEEMLTTAVQIANASGAPTAPPPGTINLGGGDIVITANAGAEEANFDMVRPGTWMMLCRRDGNDSNLANRPRVCKWYRIVSATEGTDTGTLDLTLDGADWVWGSNGNDTYACIFDSAVAVYEKVIHLDGASIWNQ